MANAYARRGVLFLRSFSLFIPFTVIPGAAIGSITILIVTRYLHRHVFKWALFGVGVVALVCAVLFLKPMQAEDLEKAQMVAALTELLHTSRMTVQPDPAELLGGFRYDRVG